MNLYLMPQERRSVWWATFFSFTLASVFFFVSIFDVPTCNATVVKCIIFLRSRIPFPFPALEDQYEIA